MFHLIIIRPHSVNQLAWRCSTGRGRRCRISGSELISPRIGMASVIEIAGGDGLHHPSGVHHQHAVTEAAHQVDIVADKISPSPRD